MNQDKKYLAAAKMLSSSLFGILEKIPPDIQGKITEIRLREGKPICLMAGEKTYFINKQGEILPEPEPAFLLKREQLQEAFISVCGWAVHSHQKELTEGYIAVQGGHRAGVAATAVVQEGQITAVRDITSLNLRVAREIWGAADPVMQKCFSGQTPGILIAGAPARGKTTILRDLARQLASARGGYRKVCIIDESGEIGGAASGTPVNDLGISSDVLFGYPKGKGLQIALRYLSPQVMICDEIFAKEEIQAVKAAANSGIAVITSIHAGSRKELLRKPQLQPLLQAGAFSYFVFLEGAARPARISGIERTEK